jgi:hypothetical protein
MTEGMRQDTPLLAVSSGFRTVMSLVCDALDAPQRGATAIQIHGLTPWRWCRNAPVFCGGRT